MINQKIELNKYLRPIFKFTENLYEKDVLRNLKLAKSNFKSIKKINFFVEKEVNLNYLIKKAIEKSTQVDETAICQGFLKLYQ